ncbi:MAG: TIGR02530 family flagellar biosynthesis protein [Bacillota bacterium]|nr:TIGR02530 family flagellar biosynthesis protein [Bacillota bacterium]
MTNRINNQNIRRVGQSNQNLNKQKIERNTERFHQIYQQEITNRNEIKLSAHAKQRLRQRNIELSETDMNALSRGMQKAEEKGGKESLLLYKDLAFIASVRNRTLITAVDQNETKENVFTNIDSAVIIEE